MFVLSGVTGERWCIDAIDISGGAHPANYSNRAPDKAAGQLVSRVIGVSRKGVKTQSAVASATTTATG